MVLPIKQAGPLARMATDYVDRRLLPEELLMAVAVDRSGKGFDLAL